MDSGSFDDLRHNEVFQEITFDRIEMALRMVIAAYRANPRINLRDEIERQVAWLAVEELMHELYQAGVVRVIGVDQHGERIWGLT